MSSEIPLIPPVENPSVPSPDDLPRPGFWRRLLCWLLDVVILAVIGVAVNVWILGAEMPDMDAPEIEAATPSNVEFVVNAAVGFLYFGLMHGCFGKTVGKMVGRFRVAKTDGRRAGLGRAFLRAFWFPGILGLIELPRFLYPEAGLGWVSDFGAIWLLLDCLVLLVDQRCHRALHDRLAGTRVVMDAVPDRAAT